MHRDVLLIPILAAALAWPTAASAFDPVDAFGMTTVVSGSSGLDAQNPFVDGTLSLRPSMKLTSNLTLGSRLDIAKEFTDDDANDERHETILSNLSFTLSHNKLIAIGDLITLSGMGRFYVPTSESSQFQGLNTSVRFGGTVLLDLAPAAFRVSSYVQKNFHDYTMAEREDCSDGLQCVTGSQLSSWQSIWSFDLGFALPAGLSLDLNYALSNSHGYANNVTLVSETGALGAADGEQVGSHATADGLHQRFLHTASVGLSYELVAGTTIEGSVANGWMPQLRANGRDFYSPFIGYRNFGNSTAVGLSLSYAL